MDNARVAKPIVANDTAQPGKPVTITIETAPAEESTVPSNSSDDRAELVPQQSWQTDPLFYEMANFLGVESREYDAVADQVSVITDWAIKQSGSNKIEDIMHVIRGLEDKLQPPPWGERRYSHIYRALRMESRYEAAKKAMGAFSKTGKWD